MNTNVVLWQAFGTCDGTGVPVVTNAHGCRAANTGVGIWLVTLDQPINDFALASCVQDSLAAGAPAATLTNFKVINTTHATKEIRYYDTAALADGIVFTFAFGNRQFS